MTDPFQNRIGDSAPVKLTPEQQANNAAILERLEAERWRLYADCRQLQQKHTKQRKKKRSRRPSKQTRELTKLLRENGEMRLKDIIAHFGTRDATESAVNRALERKQIQRVGYGAYRLPSPRGQQRMVLEKLQDGPKTIDDLEGEFVNRKAALKVLSRMRQKGWITNVKRGVYKLDNAPPLSTSK